MRPRPHTHKKENNEREKGGGSVLPVDEVPPAAGRRGAVGFLHGEEKSEKGVDVPPLQWPGGVKDLGFFFPLFPQHMQPALGWWKMGTPATSTCGLILSLILTCQLVTVSQTLPSVSNCGLYVTIILYCRRGQVEVTNHSFYVLLKTKKRGGAMCLCCYLCSVNSVVCWCRAAHIQVGCITRTDIAARSVKMLLKVI